MGKRSGVLAHEVEFLAAPLAVLDEEVARCEMMIDITGSSRNRKSLESRLHWLAKVRSRHPEAIGEA
jgi:hypothetical protein